MSRIEVLSKDISELIAAGEVIERPSSVIKELVENSIDSGATSITVEIKNGGITYMRITDNGSGMFEKDVPIAFLRHATSKIKSKDDLHNIFTLGFRGEALASICAVARVEVLTKTADEQYGTHYVIEGSEEKLYEKTGCPDGTTIIVRDIFYNVPARLKFLKKDVTEANAVSSIISKIALSHPEISFKFIRDNRQELHTPGDGELFSAIYSIFGKSFALTLLPVDYSLNSVSVKGYTVKPMYSRPNRSLQNFFVNGRFVKALTCTLSLEEAYKNSIMAGKFPACVLNISIPPGTVDVNVHPAKVEVKFSDEKMVFDGIYFAVKNALLADSPKEMEIFPKHSSVLENKPQNFLDIKTFESAQPMEQMQLNSSKIEYKSNFEIGMPVSKPVFVKEENTIRSNESHKENIKIEREIEREQFKYINKTSFEKKQHEQHDFNEDKKEDKKDIRIIGEAFATYIIAEIEDSMVLIDKHAGHERIIFEKIKNSQNNLDIQLLLYSVDVFLSFEEYDAFIQNKEMLSRLGFSFEAVKAPYIRILGMPVYLNGFAPEEIIPELAKNLLDYKRNPMPEVLDDMYHTIACKAAIKANDKNQIEELKVLALKIYEDENIRYCPHGRPVMIKITKKELEKQFKRIL